MDSTGPRQNGPVDLFMEITIRDITPDDISAVIGLIREFAEFERLSAYCEITEDRLTAALFSEAAIVEGLIALDGSRPIGYALYFPNFSSFRGQCGFYLEDIYVSGDYRGQAIGEAMLKQIAQGAVERGFERIDFLVLDWNTKATDFYLRLGAVRDDQERHFKFTDEAFRRLAS